MDLESQVTMRSAVRFSVSFPANRPFPPDVQRIVWSASFPSFPAALPPREGQRNLYWQWKGLKGRESNLYFVNLSFVLYLYLIAPDCPTLDFPMQVPPTQVQPKKQAVPG